MRFRVSVQAQQDIIVEANNAEEARMKVIDEKVSTILNTGCRKLGIDAYVGDAIQIDEAMEYAKYLA